MIQMMIGVYLQSSNKRFWQKKRIQGINNISFSSRIIVETLVVGENENGICPGMLG